VQETSGFGSQYCGWHTYTTINSKAVKYSFVGNPLLIAPSGCGVRNPSPNGDGGADAMASVIFHELVEAVSDPQLNAWYDTRGYENGDKCAWTYGTTFTAPNGGTANVLLGSRYFLIQRNWVNANGGYCAVCY
jgi:Phosphate-induced protein 1 conserved region